MHENLRLQAKNFLLADECAYRTCILYETLRGKPIEETFRNIKEVMPSLDYLDFEYWYYRFLNGNLDLNHDRNTDPETRGLSEMPLDVVERITGNLDAFSLLCLRKVSRSLRSAVDRKKTRFGSIHVVFHPTSTELAIDKRFWRSDDDQSIEYSTGFSTYVKVKNFFKNEKVKHQSVQGNHRESACNDLLTLIKNPNWSFKSLHIECVKKPAWLKVFKSVFSTTKIRVEKLHYDSDKLAPMVSILPYFDSDVLKTINFETCFRDEELIEKIVKLVQWKNAEELHLNNIPRMFDIRNMFHAKEITVRSCCLNEERLLTIRDVLLKSSSVEKCSFGVTITSDQIKILLSQDPAFNNENWRYQVDGADHYYQFKNRPYSLDIQKIMI